MSTGAVVWIDHKEAHIFHLKEGKTEGTTVMAPTHNIHHKHPPSGGEPREHPDDAKRFFRDVERSLEGTERVLVVGPSTAKLELLRHVRTHDPALEARVVGVETVDHPTSGELVAYAKKYLHVS